MKKYLSTILLLSVATLTVAQIADNTKTPLSLMKDPYLDWVYRWKLEGFTCDTMYYTAEIEQNIIDSAIQTIKNQTSFKIHFLYRGKMTSPLELSKEEQAYLLTELEKHKSHRWDSNLFPNSKRIELTEIQNSLNITEKLPSESEKNMCSIVYTFSKPIFLRDNTITLFLDQKKYRTNYTQLEFNFYTFQNNRWEVLATVYNYYESE
ncbi:hypothetical protein [Longitalea luteola]|uniref:hypothetical protein n=1 Tax=Longitalea luteola TaxID=2812563 RepID=UPI001A97A0C1|nr:hypothetical protein [Longitalea luteola]